MRATEVSLQVQSINKSIFNFSIYYVERNCVCGLLSNAFSEPSEVVRYTYEYTVYDFMSILRLT